MKQEFKDQLKKSEQEISVYQYEVSLMPLYDNPVYGLIGEVGEVVELIKKDQRTNDKRKPLDKELLKEELGDVLWYLTRIATENEIYLGDIAWNNISKLKKRHAN